MSVFMDKSASDRALRFLFELIPPAPAVVLLALEDGESVLLLLLLLVLELIFKWGAAVARVVSFVSLG